MLPSADCAQALQAPLMQRIIQVESGGNRFAIGIVGNQLVRQPTSLREALSTARALASQGLDYSIGIGQVNRTHFARLQWSGDLSRGFDLCSNVLAAAEIFNDCFARALRQGYAAPGVATGPKDGLQIRPDGYSAIHAGLSCYYSGDFERGARLGYVAKVLGTLSRPDAQPKFGLASSSTPSMMID